MGWGEGVLERCGGRGGWSGVGFVGWLVVVGGGEGWGGGRAGRRERRGRRDGGQGEISLQQEGQEDLLAPQA